MSESSNQVKRNPLVMDADDAGTGGDGGVFIAKGNELYVASMTFLNYDQAQTAIFVVKDLDDDTPAHGANNTGTKNGTGAAVVSYSIAGEPNESSRFIGDELKTDRNGTPAYSRIIDQVGNLITVDAATPIAVSDVAAAVGDWQINARVLVPTQTLAAAGAANTPTTVHREFGLQTSWNGLYIAQSGLSSDWKVMVYLIPGSKIDNVYIKG